MRLHTLLLVLAGVASTGVPSRARGQSGVSPVLDRVEGDYVNLAPVPIRPILWLARLSDAHEGPSEDAFEAVERPALPNEEIEASVRLVPSDIYVASTHGDYVAVFDEQLIKRAEFPTLPGPSALARYDPAGPGDFIAVVCQSADAVMLLDRATGAVRDIYPVPAEPADILAVPGTSIVLISSMGEDVVVELDLSLGSDALTNRSPTTYRGIGRRPAFLSKNHRAELFVAPLLSGNQSMAMPGPPTPGLLHNTHAGDQGIVSTRGWSTPLTDDDLYRLDRVNRVAVPTVESAGTIIFAHGEHPVSRQTWILNMELHNVPPVNGPRGLASLRGQVSSHRALVFPTSGGGRQQLALDFPPPMIHRSVGIPFALDFVGTADAVIAGLLTSSLTQISPSGVVVREWALNPGCIPRQVVAKEAEERLVVFCEGYNEIVEVATSGALRRVSIGYEPTPTAIRHGRRVFFDAQFSQLGNAACPTCHIEGGGDNLPWDFFDPPYDDPGPMITLSLKGVNRTGPHHWRGEQHRELQDFLAAFDKLLGGSTQGLDFFALERYMRSLEPPPNPRQAEDRSLGARRPVPDHLKTAPGAAVDVARGAALFQGCAGCHRLPTGGSGELVDTGLLGLELRPERQILKIAPFLTAFERGLLPEEIVQENGQTASIAAGARGAGLAHAGVVTTVKRFVEVFHMSPRDQDDVVGFLWAFDTGLAPATRAHVLIEGASSASAQAAADAAAQRLFQQSAAGNADVVAFGTLGPTSPVGRAWYRPLSGAFELESGTATLSPTALFAAVRAGGGWLVVHGVPPGMGARRSVDIDGDGVKNLDETTTDPRNPTSRNPPLLDLEPNGVAPTIVSVREVFKDARRARVSFETSEPANWFVIYQDRFGESRVLVGPDYAIHHSIMLTGLASGPNVIDYSVWDSANNILSGAFIVDLPPDPPLLLRTADIQAARLATIGGARTYRVAVTLAPTGAPVPTSTRGFELAVTVLEGSQPVSGLVAGPGTRVDLQLRTSTEVVIAPLDQATLQATFQFTVPAAHPGTLNLKVEGRVGQLLDGTPFQPTAMNLPGEKHRTVSFADAPRHLRLVSLP